MMIDVIKPGLLTTLQDTGRPGFAHLGIGRSGASDLPALRIANALCGNPRDACALEITLLGPILRFRDDSQIAITGAPLPVAVDGVPARMWSPLHVPAAATVTFGAMRSGCRSYLAVRGGIDAQPVLGSRSVDVNAALGPGDGRALRARDLLATGRCGDTPRFAPAWWLDAEPWFDPDGTNPLRVLPGSHLERLTESSRNNLFSHAFKVQPNSNRVGIRLAGPALAFDAPIEMISEGCVPGLLQLPPSGQPIVFGPECPVSGGYPRLGQVAAADLPRLAQCRPGDTLRFTPCTLDEARHALLERERMLARLEAHITLRLRGA